jgi:iron complex transport system ATP-binding protein
LLSADNVSFAYGGAQGGRAAVRGVTLTVSRGDLVGILGPNGSGKTTLLKLLAGMLRPLRGTVRLDGRDLAAWPRQALARSIAVVPQETHPAFEYSVLEIVLMGRYPHLGPFALEGPDDLRVAREALDATGTRAFEGRLFHTLSGGEKQRVVIAAALAQSAHLLLLDEPTSSLDLAYQLEVAHLIATLHRERESTVVLSTHDLNFAASVCRSVVLLRDGAIVAAGPTEEVLTPKHIRRVYGVEAEVSRHPTLAHLVVLPIGPRKDAQ